ncbi:MAG TPA: PAS domain-containing protein [Stellaceae bacterium]|nr:PAS domain-containing protein [Stellaceae bacterium]
MQTNSDIEIDTTGWHPSLIRLYRYWTRIHPPGAALLPARRHFDPVEVPDLLPGIWLLDVQQSPFRLRYRLAGTGIVDAIGHEVTGLWFDEAHRTIGQDADLMRSLRLAVCDALPQRQKGKPRLWSHHEFALVENLLLPLAGDGRRVDMLCAYTVLYRPDGSAAF